MKIKNLFTFLISEYPLIIVNQIMPLYRKNPPKNWQRGKKGSIVLIPGHRETWIFLETIGNYLNSKGYKIYCEPKLKNNVLTLERSAVVLEKLINSIEDKKIILIAHSRGGIIAKLLLNTKTGKKKIRKIVSIATPYQGTHLGYLRFQNLWQLAPGSKYIKKVNENKSDNKQILNLYAKIDDHIIPNLNAILPGAKNVEIDVVGHARILESSKTLEEIGKVLQVNDKKRTMVIK